MQLEDQVVKWPTPEDVERALAGGTTGLCSECGAYVHVRVDIEFDQTTLRDWKHYRWDCCGLQFGYYEFYP